jgi:hypothetical protein
MKYEMRFCRRGDAIRKITSGGAAAQAMNFSGGLLPEALRFGEKVVFAGGVGQGGR